VQKRLREATSYMLTHRAKELSLIPKRLAFLYRHDHAAVDWIGRRELPVGESTLDRLRTASGVYYFAALGLAVVGVWYWWRGRREFVFVLLGIIVCLSALIGALFFGDQRYHALLIPVICLLAAPGVVALSDAGSAAMRRCRARP
jgi:hypothetical protein